MHGPGGGIVAGGVFSSLSVAVKVPILFFVLKEFDAFPAPAKEAAAEAQVVDDLGQRHETEAHAKSQETARAGNVRNSGHFLRLAEAFRVRLLDEDVDNGEVLPRVVVDLGLDLLGQSLVGEAPAVSPLLLVAHLIDRRRDLLEQRTKPRVFRGQRLPLVALARPRK